MHRARPQRAQREHRVRTLTEHPEMLARLQVVRGFLKEGFTPAAIAGLVVDAIRSDTFYVVPAQPNIEAALALRLEDIRLRRNPTILPPLG